MAQKGMVAAMNAEYSAISAKLKAMYSKFLTKEDYEQLLSLKSVGEICGYLKSQPAYKSVLENVNERDIHRGQIEILISNEIVEEYLRLYDFLDSSKREVLKFWFMRREIAFLTRELRYIFTHESRNADPVSRDRFDAFFETHTKIDREHMLNAANLSDCIEACKNTPYLEPLQRAENLGADFFSVSMILEMFYYTSIWRTLSTRLSRSQAELFKKALGTKIDALNILWIYRGKKYFKFEDEIIFTYLIPIRYRLTEDFVKEIVQSETQESFIAKISETKYAMLFEGIDDGIFPDENYMSLIRKIDKRMFVNHPQSLIAVYTYLDLKELELNNIKTVVEGIRYNKSPESIRPHIHIE